jgi:hypothetical protein
MTEVGQGGGCGQANVAGTDDGEVELGHRSGSVGVGAGWLR